MLNWWLIVVAVLAFFLTIGLVFYLVFLYQSEEDKNQAWLPKIIVVSGLSLACFNVLLLPYDVANRFDPEVANSAGGGIDVVLMWQIVLWAIAAFTFVIVPFAIFYYEAYDPDQGNVCNQLKPAVCYTTIALFFFVLALILLWLLVGQAEIPYQLYKNSPVPASPVIATENAWYAVYGFTWVENSSDATLDVQVSIFVYMVGLMAALGWILFFVFGGIGLAALPMDLISDFINRPKPITVTEYTARKEIIGKETLKLISDGKELDEQERTGTTGRKHKKKILLFKRRATALEEAFEKLEASYKHQENGVLKAWLGLFLGLGAAMLSLAWFLHIILNNIANVTPFLNAMFVALDRAFSLLGTAAYGIFAFYLLWCVVKGCCKFGMNFLIFQVHPMKIHDTMMNSFLFNTLLILISSVSVVQFCSVSFREYANNTAVDSLFTVFVSRLKGINYVTLYLQYSIVGVMVLAFLWLLICPRCKKKDDDDE